MHLIFGNQTEEDMLLREVIEDLAAQCSRLHVWYTLDRPPAAWEYSTGYITEEMLRERMPPPAIDTLVVACGPKAMVKASLATLGEMGYDEVQRIVQCVGNLITSLSPLAGRAFQILRAAMGWVGGGYTSCTPQSLEGDGASASQQPGPGCWLALRSWGHAVPPAPINLTAYWYVSRCEMACSQRHRTPSPQSSTASSSSASSFLLPPPPPPSSSCSGVLTET
jgi:hypothetical protein